MSELLETPYFETASVVMTCIALALLLFMVFLNFYLIRRNGFHVNVNCWFCNTWTKVLYSNRNSFECPSCLQYNGFEKDGSYNKIIHQQHAVGKLKATVNGGNGLCNYCNNNQQLKVFQLANFVPLIEDNYDVEIEHFQKQLEKAYRLCKKCDKVLKSTIEKQESTLFGNRLKSLRKLRLLEFDQISKITSQPIVLTLVRVPLFISTIIILVNEVCSVVIKYSLVKEKLPDVLGPYHVILTQFYSYLLEEVSRVSTRIPRELRVYNPQVYNVLFFAVFLEAIQLVWDRQRYSKLTKAKRLISWTNLILTVYFPLSKFVHHANILRLFCATYLFYSFFVKEVKPQRKMFFKKLRKDTSCRCSSSFEEKTLEEDTSVSSSETNTANNDDAAFKTSVFNPDLSKRLDDLHLGLQHPETVPSPGEVKTVTQNSWTAGGFWKNDEGLILPVIQNLSRSSSQSSGFVSQQNEIPPVFSYCDNPSMSLPNFRNNSVCGDYEHQSLFSEPAYHFNPISQNGFVTSPMMGNSGFKPLPQMQQLYYRSENTFYPVLNQDNMLFLRGGGNNSSHVPPPHHLGGFKSNFSPPSFGKPAGFTNNDHLGFIKPSPFHNANLGGVSGLFKNLQGAEMQHQSFGWRQPKNLS